VLAGDTHLMDEVTRSPGNFGSADDLRDEHFGLSAPWTGPVSLQVIEQLELDETEEDLGVRLRVLDAANNAPIGSIIVYTVEADGLFWVSTVAYSAL